MRSRTLASSLVFVLILAAAEPLAAAARNRDRSQPEPPLDRLVRVIKKLFTPASESHGLIPPIP